MARSQVESRLEKKGWELPKAPKPIAQYVPARRWGDLIYVSGQGPILKGKAISVGRVGQEISLEEARIAARVCALNSLAAIKDLIGTLDAVEQVVHLRGFVNSAPEFHSQPAVMDGASEVLIAAFGEDGRHARAALGTSNLPGNIPVEIEVLVAVKAEGAPAA